MPMQFHNTATRKKEVFAPMREGEVRMYACGPTVYDYFHIGNARAFVVFDTLRRVLEQLGLEKSVIALWNVARMKSMALIDDREVALAEALGQ